MFSFLRRPPKQLLLHAPAPGKVLPLEEVPDPVFAAKMLGEGFAVQPEGTEISAPCAGVVLLVAPTRHAVALGTAEGVEILIHTGLDTVELNGEGFQVHVREGQALQQGDRLLTFDPALLERRGKSAVTPVVVTNCAEKVAKTAFSAAATAPLVLTLK